MIGNALELPVFRTDAPLERRCFNAQLLQPRVVVSNDAIVDRGGDLVASALGASPELLDSPLSLDQSEQSSSAEPSIPGASFGTTSCSGRLAPATGWVFEAKRESSFDG